MEKIARYTDIIQQVLQEYVEDAGPDDEVELSFDTLRTHYHVFYVGWHDERRTYGCILHLDIKNDKIWIQHDGTEIGIANELLKHGVPKEDIVLAFHSPYRRQFTGFAVN